MFDSLINILYFFVFCFNLSVFFLPLPLLIVPIHVIRYKERFDERVAHCIALWNSILTTVTLRLCIDISDLIDGSNIDARSNIELSCILAFCGILYYWIYRVLLTKRAPVKKNYQENNHNTHEEKDDIESSSNNKTPNKANDGDESSQQEEAIL